MKSLSNQEILEKAIQKAIANGWNFMDYSKAQDKFWAFKRDYDVEDDGIHSKGPYSCQECYSPTYTVDDIIFSHDFAKALWGEELHKEDYEHASTVLVDENWKWHLRCMVVAEDPIAYLGEHLDD